MAYERLIYLKCTQGVSWERDHLFRMEIIRVYRRGNNDPLFLHRNRWLHPHLDCLPGRLHLRRDMVVRRASCLQGSMRRLSRPFRRSILARRLDSVPHQDLPPDRRRDYHPASKLRDTGGLDDQF